MKKSLEVETIFVSGVGWVVRCDDAVMFVAGLADAAGLDYTRGFREGYERRDAEVKAALA